MQGPTSALAALTATLMLAGCTAPKVNAKEPPHMSATASNSNQAFFDPAILPLAHAVAAGDVAAIRALAPKSNLAARGDKNVTLLEWAIWNQRPQSLEALLDAGADPTLLGMDDETVVHMAAMVDPPEYLEVLVRRKVPLDVERPTNGWTPLFVAAMYRQPTQLDLLIRAGADVKHRDALGNTPLFFAGNNADIALKLLEAGTDPTVKNRAGRTFQSSFFMTQERLLTAEGKRGREKVRSWLRANDIPLEY